jgi:hypothetical protein
MLAVANAFPLLSLSADLRTALLGCLAAAHRPELADPDFPGLWLRPHDSGLNAAWLAGKLWAAALESGLPLEWMIHRRRQLPGFYSDLFFRLWREPHPATPAQLRLPFAA